MFLPTRALFTPAYGHYALGHFNVNTMEQLLGLFQGATEARAPFILAFSRAARAYARPRMLEAMTRAAHDLFPDAVLAVHLDHGDEATCYDAIDSGFYTSVMIDGSHLPFDDNVALTRRVAQRAHAQGLSVEAELGVLKGVEDDLNVDQSLLTDPDQAAEFVQRTACDSLAVAVGTSHGAYKFSGPENLRLDRLKAIQTRLPGFPLVLHGASSVDLREVERINGAGGAMPTTAKGVDEQILSEAIRRGVTKVNIATDGRLLWTRVHREFFRDRPEAFDPAEPGRAFMQAFAQLVAHKCTVLRSAGRLESISKQLSVSDPQGL